MCVSLHVRHIHTQSKPAQHPIALYAIKQLCSMTIANRVYMQQWTTEKTAYMTQDTLTFLQATRNGRVPWSVSMATRLIPPAPWGILPTPQAWHRAPREGTQPRSWQGDRGCRAPVAGRMLLCMLCLLPARSRGAEDLGRGCPPPSSPVVRNKGCFEDSDVTRDCICLSRCF